VKSMSNIMESGTNILEYLKYSRNYLEYYKVLYDFMSSEW
jgi:hypothetical protein